jgi:heme a synthase
MNLNRYQLLAVTTVIATIVLIFVGGLVRASGAGLGCPDWPKCFGMWIPPTSAEALPPEFNAEEFNPLHTWLEYVNRLVGVLIGFLITLTFIFSWKYRKSDPVITISAGIAFILVLFQGWLGGQVVQSGLSAGLITLHMIMAMIIVNVLLFTAFRSASRQLDIHLPETLKNKLMGTGIVLLVLIVIQMIIGTQVREMIDIIKNVPEPPPRSAWIDLLDNWIYPLHRSFSWVVVAVTGGFWWLNRKYAITRSLKVLSNIVVKLVLLQIVLGVGLEWLDMPGVLQVLHLVGVALLICAVFLYLLMIGFSKTGDDEAS